MPPKVSNAYRKGGCMAYKNELPVQGRKTAVDFAKIGITNDVMFGTVFKNEDDCKELLQRILGIEICELTIVESQKTIKTTLLGKGIRIDVYVKDNYGNAYDIEMQTTKDTELHLRSRYYHSEMDGYQIRAGEKYSNLKNSIVIFICSFDPFADKRCIYTFQTNCMENKDITLDDKRTTYFVNIYGNREGMNKKTADLLEYFKTGKPTDSYTKNIQDQVIKYREDDEWRDNYMTLEMKMDQRYEEGKMEGERDRDQELIMKWLQKGKTIAQIAEDLDKTEVYVKSLMSN